MPLADYILTIIGATVVSIVFFVRRPNVRDKGSVLLSLYLLSFGLGLWLRVEAVYMQVDMLLGYHNIAWLLSRLFLTSSVYLVVLSLTTSFSTDLPRWTFFSLLLVLGLHIYLFTFYTQSSQSLLSSQPILNELSTMVSRSAMLFEAAMLSVFLVKMFLKIQGEETSLFVRCRWILFLVSSISACVNLTVKGLFNVLGYYEVVSPSILQLMNGVILIAQTFILFFLLCFLPQTIFHKLVKPLNIVLKGLMLRDLEYLRHCLTSITDNQSTKRMGYFSFFSQYREIDFLLHSAYITILDKEYLLLRKQDVNDTVKFLKDQLQSLKLHIDNAPVVDKYFQDIFEYSRLGKSLRKIHYKRTLAAIGPNND